MTNENKIVEENTKNDTVEKIRKNKRNYHKKMNLKMKKVQEQKETIIERKQKL